MSDPLAISLDNISKVYRLYGGQRVPLMDVLGLRSRRNRRQPVKEFHALQNVSLQIPKGHKIGIVGRNGAGKTTLLKLICGNFTPTAGKIKVVGTVQALMSVGIGFHPEYTGRENIESSLYYNGLSREQHDEAIEGIIDFCELGEFLDQPFKTYSLGMKARLMFATATAVKPDILIVDEVLGAGDSYFVSKSKRRIEKLIQGGCTMLLVSHSMQQILELCKETIWMDEGRIHMQGNSFEVVKAYEEFMHGSMLKHLSSTSLKKEETRSVDKEVKSKSREKLPAEFDQNLSFSSKKEEKKSQLQVPFFRPQGEKPLFPQLSLGASTTFEFGAAGGVSRWGMNKELKVSGFTVLTERGPSNELVVLEPVKFIIFILVEKPGSFRCRYGVAINDERGEVVARIYSPIDQFSALKGEIRRIELTLNPNQLGPGDYAVGISVLGDSVLERVDDSYTYDLLNKSFAFKVVLPDSLQPINCRFFHSAEWQYTSEK